MQLNILYVDSLARKYCVSIAFFLGLNLALNSISAKTTRDEDELRSKTQDAVKTAYLDFSSIVTAQERSDWILDEYALREMTPKLAQVYCQLSTDALVQLEKDIASVGVNHSAKTYYDSEKSKNKDFKIDQKFKDLLHKERIALAFQQVKKYKSKCPFWLAESDGFLGIHRDAGRLQLLAETMGGLQLQKSKDSLYLGGAAQGRLIGVYGISPSWGLGVGVEAGGASTFPKDEQGRRSLKAQWTAGIPFLWRGWWDNKRVDIELTPIARFDDQIMSEGRYGGRLAFSFGVSPLRVFGILPHIMAWVGVEQFFDQDSTLVLRSGTRIGFSL